MDAAMERWEDGKMDVRQTEDENKPLLSLYDRFAIVVCSQCIFFNGSDKIWKLVQSMC